MAEPFISLERVSKSFGGVHSLSDVSIHFRPGEAIALAGENGSGKSTLIKVLSGVHAPTSGQVIINGIAHSSLRPIDAVRAGVQVIFQDFSLFPNLTVEENITFGYALSERQTWWKPKTTAALTQKVLEQLDVELDPKARVEDLPVVGKQLTAIARALLSQARLIIMDEPTTALTDKEVRILLGIVKRLKNGGVSVLFVSHKLEELFSVCDRIVVLRNGRLISEGNAQDYTSHSLTQHMTGRSAPESRLSDARRVVGDVALSLRDASSTGAFERVSLSVRRGEVLGIAGRLGGGRTELAEAIFGLVALTSGELEIAGVPVRLRSPQDAIRHGIAYVPEDRLSEGLFFGRSVANNMESGLLDRFSDRFGRVGRKSLSATVETWLARLRIKATMQQNINTLSGGNQQRVLLAKWLAQEPQILLLNGPSVGVDVGSKAEIHNVIRTFASTGLATLLISDDLSELVTCCDRVLIMKGGVITHEIGSKDLSEAGLSATLAE
jgi:simple sugar transport system ATP-binding protein